MPALLLFIVAARAADMTAVAGAWQPRATAFGQVSATKHSVLRLPFPARIITLQVEPGARVALGQPLLRFTAPTLVQHLAAWRTARQALAVARKDLQILRNGEHQHTTTRHDRLAGEETMLRTSGLAQRAWGALSADLEQLFIHTDAASLAKRIDSRGVPMVASDLGLMRAPFAATVVRRDAAPDEWLASGRPLLELQSLQRVYVDVGVTQAALATWRHGETRWRWGAAHGVLDPMPGVARYDNGTGLWLLRFAADNPDLRLRDDAWLQVEHLGAPRGVVWVAAAAVVSRNGKTWCVVHQGKRFTPLEVRVGAAVDGRIPVLSGLDAGVRVVTTGAYEHLYRDLKDLVRFED